MSLGEWIMISLLLALITSCFGGNMVKFSTHPGVNIMTGSVAFIDTLSEPNTYCALRCQNISLCGGFIYHSGAGQCDLFEGKPTQAQLQVSLGDAYYESMEYDQCLLTPCQHGGTCTYIGNGIYTCACATGYTGGDCEIDIDDCVSLPCQNGGLCVDDINAYSCNCVAGYTGVHCEININECLSGPCLNGGSCIDGVNSFTCDCAPLWTGLFCGKECYLSGKGEDYMGTISVTETGLTCQRWDKTSPQFHTLTSDGNYPDATRTAANNYCRNPSDWLISPEARPWCYTTDPSTRWRYCDLHKCP